jgi:RNA polymerase primary sigma factor
MIEAAQRFDGSRDVKFVTYAAYWIRQTIERSTSMYTDTAPTTHTHRKKLRWIKSVLKFHQDEQLGTPSFKAIAAATGIRAESVYETMSALSERKSVRLHEPVAQNGEGKTHLEVMQDPNAIDPEDRLMQQKTAEVVKLMLKVLGDRERTIVKLYFGIDGVGPYTLEAIGERFNLSRERVRQIIRDAKDKIRRENLRRERAAAETRRRSQPKPSKAEPQPQPKRKLVVWQPSTVNPRGGIDIDEIESNWRRNTGGPR